MPAFSRLLRLVACTRAAAASTDGQSLATGVSKPNIVFQRSESAEDASPQVLGRSLSEISSPPSPPPFSSSPPPPPISPPPPSPPSPLTPSPGVPVTYSFGTLNDAACNDCNAIDDATACFEASLQLGFEWGGSVFSENAPSDCYYQLAPIDTVQQIHFNEHPNGRANLHATPVCQHLWLPPSPHERHHCPLDPRRCRRRRKRHRLYHVYHLCLRCLHSSRLCLRSSL